MVPVCHTADREIEGFANRPFSYHWQLFKMPTTPLIRLELTILDHPSRRYRFESFLNVAEEDQARVLAQLAGQEQLYLAFYGDDLSHRFTKIVNHDRQQWQYLDELVAGALNTASRLPRSSATSTKLRWSPCGGFYEAGWNDGPAFSSFRSDHDRPRPAQDPPASSGAEIGGSLPISSETDWTGGKRRCTITWTTSSLDQAMRQA